MRFFAIATAGLLVAGAARADDDIEVDVANVARSDFTTRARAVTVEQAACSLGAHAQVEGRDRPLDMRVQYDGKVVLCPVGGANGITLVIRADPAPNGFLHVVVEADMPGASAAALKELEQTLREVTAELARRSAFQKTEFEPKPEIHFRPTRAFSPALTVTGIVVAALGFASLGIGYFWFAASSSTATDVGPPVAMMLGGGGGILMGALFALVGEHRVPMEANQSRLIPGGFRF
jgi:hypothetical protein